MSTLRIETEHGLATIRMDKGRGNAIDAPLVEELTRAAAGLAADPAVRGVLLASAHPKLFCPGLDLVSLSEYDRPGMQRFILDFAECVWGLFGMDKPLVAAINGHAVAGGCVLALTADHRVLRRGTQIGLNEVKIGVPLPWSVTVLLRWAAAAPHLERVALFGNNFEGDAAVAAGLAHEVIDADGFEEACRARLAELAEKDAQAFATTKRYLRESSLEQMRAHERERVSDFLDGWFSAPTRERISATVASLRAKG